jgi:hypothetical protein
MSMASLRQSRRVCCTRGWSGISRRPATFVLYLSKALPSLATRFSMQGTPRKVVDQDALELGPDPALAAIFREYAEAYRSTHTLCAQQRRVMQAIEGLPYGGPRWPSGGL